MSQSMHAGDPEALATGWRCLHCAGACLYLLAAETLHGQRRFMACILHAACFSSSVLWSFTRHGGPGGWLHWMDHALAYLVVGYNYTLAYSWGKPGWLLTARERELAPLAGWTNIQTRGFVICHLAALIFISEDVMRERYGVEAWLSYGVVHFM